MNPMKKLFCGLMAVVLICTMVTWPSKPAEAGSGKDYYKTFAELYRLIDTAAEGETLNLYLDNIDVLEFPQSITIRRPVTINFYPKFVESTGTFRSTNQTQRLFNIEADNVVLFFNNITLTSNIDGDPEGGAIKISENQNVTIRGAIFDHCSSDNGGGAIYVKGRTRGLGNHQSAAWSDNRIENCIFKDCYTRGTGGAIRDISRGLSIKGCEFYRCKSKKEGGAIWSNDQSLIENSYFKDCESTEQDAGAIFVRGDYTNIKDCIFNGCRADYSGMDGGAIKLSYFLSGNHLKVENCRFINCGAAGDGKWIDGATATTIVHCTRPYLRSYYYKCTYSDYNDPGCKAKYLTKVDNNPPTCTKDGWAPYYECSCGLFYSEPTPGPGTLIGSTFNPQGYLEAWKYRGLGYRAALGHNIEYNVHGNRISASCKNDPEHKASLLLVVNNTYYSSEIKNVEIRGNTNHEDWKKFGLDYELYYKKDGRILDQTPVSPGNYSAGIRIIKDGSVQRFLEMPFYINAKPITPQFTKLDNCFFEHDGTQKTVKLTVMDGKTPLIQGKDYTVSGDFSGTEKGEYTITVRGMGNYSGTVTEKWYIVGSPLSIETMPAADPIKYGETLASSKLSGGKVSSGLSGNVDGKFVWEAPDTMPAVSDSNVTEYTIEFIPDNKDYGIIKAGLTVTVNPKDLSNISSDYITVPTIYTGDNLIDFISVDSDGKPETLDLVKEKDYRVSCSPPSVIEPGKYTATITFMGNYKGTITKEFFIKREMGPEDVTIVVPEYSGEELNDLIKVKSRTDNKEFVKDTDYTIEFDPTTVKEIGNYTAKIEFKGYYTGKITKEFAVTIPDPGPAPEPEPSPTGHDFNFSLTGNTIIVECGNHPAEELRISLAVKDTIYSGKAENAEISGNTNHEDWRKLGLDYDFYYINESEETLRDTAPVEAGLYAAIVNVLENGEIQGIGLKESFVIDSKDITSEFVTLKDPIKTYTGGEVTVDVTVMDGKKQLKEGIDYDIEGNREKTVGKHTVKVTGKGNYSGVATEDWYIVEKSNFDPDKLMITPPMANPITYGQSLKDSSLFAGSVFYDSAEISGRFVWEDPEELPQVSDSDITKYTVEFRPTNPGDYIYSVIEQEITLTVYPRDLSREVSPYNITVPTTYTGDDLRGYITVDLDGKPGLDLIKGVDYEVTCMPSPVIEPGEYTATIRFIGNYTGQIEKKFTIFRKGQEPIPTPIQPSDGGSSYTYSGGSSSSLTRPPVTTKNSAIEDNNNQDTDGDGDLESDVPVSAYAHPNAGKALPLIRMYNPASGEHIMTTDANEAETLEKQHGWTREAMTGTSSKANNSPVFRLLHPATGKHIYSMNANEVRVLTTEQGWVSDGVVFFAGGSNVKMYRLYNPNLPAAIAHHYTTDENEYNELQAQGWTGEGVAFTLD